jgi:uncharacterized repeat protein (TIGR03803 family)
MRLRSIGLSRMWIVPAITGIVALGVVTRASAAPAYSILHTFNAYADGFCPSQVAQLLAATDGNFYGTTVEGGTNNLGTVYRLSPEGILTTIHSFTDVGDGFDPGGGLIEGPDGYLYGTTYNGPGASEGSVFKVSQDGSTFITMYKFSQYNNCGVCPQNALALDAAGNLYGATTYGAANNDGSIYTIPYNGADAAPLQSLTSSAGVLTGPLVVAGTTLYGAGWLSDGGSLFSLPDTGGAIDILHTFTNTDPAGYDLRSILLGSDGNLYGVTSAGGSYAGGGGDGALFCYNTTSADITTLYSFEDNSDGAGPTCLLTQSPSGLLYGECASGGIDNSSSSGDGTIFSVPTSGGATTILHTFPSNGTQENGGFNVTIGPDGALYGVVAGGSVAGDGLVFRQTTDGNNFSILHDFADGTFDGKNPLYGDVMFGSDGLLHGTTSGWDVGPGGAVYSLSPTGGSYIVANISGSPYGGLITGFDGSYWGTTWDGGDLQDGSVFQIDSEGAVNTVASLGGSSGSNLASSVTLGRDGNYYGTTCEGGQNGDGTIFRLTPSGAESVLYSFTGSSDGLNPFGTLALGSDGNLYGTTSGGVLVAGSSGYGTIFQFSPELGLKTIGTFNSADSGSYPIGRLIECSNGLLYGTTLFGGAYGHGTIFSIPKAGGGFSAIFSFGDPTNASAGVSPYAGVTQGSDGLLYGATCMGGLESGSIAGGTVFCIPTTLTAPTVLHTFLTPGEGSLSTDGATPDSDVTEGPDGNMYGTCSQGGVQPYAGVAVAGTVYEIATQLPVIDSFNPISGVGGGQVRIAGANFGSSPIVRFDGYKAAVVSANATEIVATVPATATTGVITVRAGGITVTSPTKFVISKPTIAGLSENAGLVGDTLTITGANFVGVESVTFGGDASAVFTVVSPTSIAATVPATGVTGPVKVTTYGGTASSPKPFTYKKPTITKFKPASGSNGTPVTITGTNFAGVSAVTFNGISSAYSVISPTSISTAVPTGATTGPVAVTTLGGTKASTSSFTVN